MDSQHFIDHYELLQICRNASEETVERMFRHFAQRYHPDNRDTGNTDKFQQVVEAYEILRDPQLRAQYDLIHKNFFTHQQTLIRDVTGADSVESDTRIQCSVLEILYQQCRNDCKNPGLGLFQITQMLELPIETIEFNVWYLKEHDWIRRMEDGLLAITATGVDKLIENRGSSSDQKKITDKSSSVIHL